MKRTLKFIVFLLSLTGMVYLFAPNAKAADVAQPIDEVSISINYVELAADGVASGVNLFKLADAAFQTSSELAPVGGSFSIPDATTAVLTERLMSLVKIRGEYFLANDTFLVSTEYGSDVEVYVVYSSEPINVILKPNLAVATMTNYSAIVTATMIASKLPSVPSFYYVEALTELENFLVNQSTSLKVSTTKLDFTLKTAAVILNSTDIKVEKYNHVTLEFEEAVGGYLIGDILRLTYEGAETDVTWVINGRSIDYGTTIELSIVDITTVVELAFQAIGTPSIDITSVINAPANDLFTVSYYLPDGYKLVETGILAINPLLSDANLLEIDNETYVERLAAVNVSKRLTEFSLVYTNADGFRAVGYLVYQNSEGQSEVVYSAEVKHIETVDIFLYMPTRYTGIARVHYWVNVEDEVYETEFDDVYTGSEAVNMENIGNNVFKKALPKSVTNLLFVGGHATQVIWRTLNLSRGTNTTYNYYKEAWGTSAPTREAGSYWLTGNVVNGRGSGFSTNISNEWLSAGPCSLINYRVHVNFFRYENAVYKPIDIDNVGGYGTWFYGGSDLPSSGDNNVWYSYDSWDSGSNVIFNPLT